MFSYYSESCCVATNKRSRKRIRELECRDGMYSTDLSLVSFLTEIEFVLNGIKFSNRLVSSHTGYTQKRRGQYEGGGRGYLIRCC